MSTARLIKLSPTVILVAYLGYSLFAIQPGLGEAADAKQALEKTLQDLMAEGSEVTDTLKGKIRDPFWVTGPAAAALQIAAAETPGKPEDDELGDLVRGLSLDATLLHGRDQLAVINGRIYTKGQRLELPKDDDSPDRDLQLLFVTRTGVILRGGGRNYALGYPEKLGQKKESNEKPTPDPGAGMADIDPTGQAALYQQLLKSPLGAMGRSLIGDAGRLGGGMSRAATAGSVRTRGAASAPGR
jgi:hypothetical protein